MRSSLLFPGKSQDPERLSSHCLRWWFLKYIIWNKRLQQVWFITRNMWFCQHDAVPTWTKLQFNLYLRQSRILIINPRPPLTFHFWEETAPGSGGESLCTYMAFQRSNPLKFIFIASKQELYQNGFRFPGMGFLLLLQNRNRQ